MTREGSPVMQHVCAWQPCAEDERFQVCGDADCGLWRWDPAYSDRAANEAHRKTREVPRKPIAPISGPNSADVAPSATGSQIGPEHYAHIDAALNREPRVLPRLAALLRRATATDDETPAGGMGEDR